MNNSKLSSLEGMALVILCILNNIIINYPQDITQGCGPSALLNVIYISVLVFIFFILVVNLFKNFTNSDILDISEFLGGKVLKTILGVLFIFIFIYISSLNLRLFTDGLKLTSFNNVPTILLLLSFLFVALITNRFGNKPVLNTALIITPIILITFIITFFTASSKFTLQRVFPLLGYGTNNIFLVGSSNLFAFSGLAYIFFLMPMLNKKENFKKVTYTSVAISTVFLFCSTALLLLTIPNATSRNELSPIFLITISTNFGNYFQNPEWGFIFIWILALMSYISISVLIISNIAKKILNIENKKNIVLLIAGFIFIFALFPKNLSDLNFWKNTIYRPISLIIVFLIPIIVLILANIKHKKINKKTQI